MSNNITVNKEIAKKAAHRKLYQLIMRWHFFCGLFFIPLILIISISGCIYLFEDEYEEFVYDDLLFVAAGEQALPASTLLSIARQAQPNMRASNVKLFNQADRSAEVIFRTKMMKHSKTSMEWAGNGPEKVPMVMNMQRTSVYINPYTGEILGSINSSDRLMGFMKDLHGNLLAGKFGSKFVELTSCWVMMLMTTGLIMWWPRGKAGIMGTLIPRLKGNKRLFWRDLHAVPAFYFSFLIIFLVISGLPWTDVWGDAFHSIQKSLNMTAPAGFHSRELKSTPIKNQQTISINHVKELANRNGLNGDLNIKIPRSPSDTYAVQRSSDDPANRPSMHIDQYSGKSLAVSDWNNTPVLAKAVAYGIKLHRGEYFGVWNLVLVLITTLVLILMAVSGLVLWLQRRPQHKLGAPKRPKHYTQPSWIIWTTAGFSAFMPLLGLSLLSFWLGNWCYTRIKSNA